MIKPLVVVLKHVLLHKYYTSFVVMLNKTLNRYSIHPITKDFLHISKREINNLMIET